MVCSLHSVTTGSRDRANVSLIIIIIRRPAVRPCHPDVIIGPPIHKGINGGTCYENSEGPTLYKNDITLSTDDVSC